MDSAYSEWLRNSSTNGNHQATQAHKPTVAEKISGVAQSAADKVKEFFTGPEPSGESHEAYEPSVHELVNESARNAMKGAEDAWDRTKAHHEYSDNVRNERFCERMENATNERVAESAQDPQTQVQSSTTTLM